jgi:hypothetical protein
LSELENGISGLSLENVYLTEQIESLKREYELLSSTRDRGSENILQEQDGVLKDLIEKNKLLQQEVKNLIKKYKFYFNR